MPQTRRFGGPGAGLDLWVAVLEQLDDLENKGLMASDDLRCLGTTHFRGITNGWRRLEDLRSIVFFNKGFLKEPHCGLLYEEKNIIIVRYFILFVIVIVLLSL